MTFPARTRHMSSLRAGGASTARLQLSWSKDGHLLAGKQELQVLPS